VVCKTAGDVTPLMANICLVSLAPDGNARHARNEFPDILAGRKDAGIDDLGRYFKACGRPVFVNLGNEFNLYTTYTPEEFIRV
jgi:hypothetical protein